MSATTDRRRLLRQTLTIARRDFTATVFTPMFLFFLLSPLLIIAFGGVGGVMGASLATSASTERLLVIAPARDTATLKATDARLRKLFSRDGRPADLTFAVPVGDPAVQARAAFDTPQGDVSAALYGPLDRPTILYGAQGKKDARYLAELADGTVRSRRAQIDAPVSDATLTPYVRARTSQSGHRQSATFAVLGVFFLTLFLAGQAVGTMAEERSNKVIEVLAAAVPLESVFLGKLLGMLGTAILFVAFWGTLIVSAGRLLPPDLLRGVAEIGPAVGMPMFLLLFFSYFVMAYMLLGAVFLGVGAQASTMREIQMLSLPITVVQMLMFALASAAVRNPGSTLATVAELFPLSSPFAMAGHAANAPELWPHLAALAWQALWVGIVIAVGARAFRRGVLQSGSGKFSVKALFGKA